MMIWHTKSGYIAIDDTRMYYVRFGHGNKTLAIIPGLSDGLTMVKGKALLLALPYRRYLNDYTIYMFSRKEPMHQGYTIRDMADDLAYAISQLGLSQVDWLGVSEGGMITQCMAIDHPELVRRLVLAVTAPCVNDVIRERINDWTNYAKHRQHKQLMIDTAEYSYSKGYLEKYRLIYPVIGLIGRPTSYQRLMVNMGAIMGFDAANQLSQIHCPTLIIGGEEDQIVGVEASLQLHDGIDNSELYLYQGLGHGAYEEAADFNDRVFDFLNQE